MSTSLSTLIRLRAIQNLTRQLFNNLNDIQYRLQFHPGLSPAGWYLGRGIFIENYWLHEVIQNDNQFTANKPLFTADHCPPAQRGPRLPALKTTLENMSAQQDENDLLLMYKTPPLSEHPLFKDEFIENYIIQQYALQYESIYSVLNQIALKKHHAQKKRHPYKPQIPLTSQALIKDITHIKAATYGVGGEWPLSSDNELPAHEIQLNDFFIANTPVTNGQYLLFIEDGGYQNKTLWSDEGWQWRTKNNIQQPEHWHQNPQQQWYASHHPGKNNLEVADLHINDAVYGISFHEASAFADWAGARLPHEHEWETAARLEAIKQTTQVWEWCHNIFRPYQGFKAFPDDPHQTVNFDHRHANKYDDKHYVLKGASQHTRPELKRASFRNAQLPHQRHIFAGLRLVFK